MIDIEQTSGAVTTIRFNVPDVNWEQWILLRSDAHHDSVHCDRDTELYHLKKAKERNAIIFDNGDLFDAMQGKFDPRRNLDDVRPEDAGIDYYDRIVQHAFDDYKPYADLFAIIGKGNHETAVLKNTNHCITTSLVDKLRASGSQVVIGDYGGWIRLMFTVHKTRRDSIIIYRHHGSGGEAPVTRGVIQTNRQSVYLPDADIVWNGHNHNSYVLPIARLRCSEAGVIYKDILWHVRTPGYKDDFGEGLNGWEVERGGVPKPVGACWLHLSADGRKGKIIVRAEQDIK
jgi:hypothetical protein